MKIICYALAMLISMCSANVADVYGAELNNPPIPKITLTCQSTPLKDVVDSVSKQTGYTIHVEESLLGMPITGEFNEIEITQFFQRILRGENLSLLFAEKDKSCMVRSFGKKEGKFYTAGNKADQVDPLTGLTLNEMKESQDEQLQAFLAYSQDPEAVDQITGLKLVDLRELEEAQTKDFIEQSNNPDSVDPLVGETLGEIKKSQDEQQQAFQAYSENPESVDGLTGLKLVDMKSSEEQQLQEFQRYSNDPNSIDPMTGLTLGQLHEQQEREMNEFLGKTE